jgi:hypothetical protein
LNPALNHHLFRPSIVNHPLSRLKIDINFLRSPIDKQTSPLKKAVKIQFAGSGHVVMPRLKISKAISSVDFK